VAAASVVSIPGLPLIPLIYSSQVVNAVLLPLHAIALLLLAQDKTIMGEAVIAWKSRAAAVVSILLIVACVVALTF
jgi:Mn2+/Fe2+ NRAMP family transporter